MRYYYSRDGTKNQTRERAESDFNIELIYQRDICLSYLMESILFQFS